MGYCDTNNFNYVSVIILNPFIEQIYLLVKKLGGPEKDRLLFFGFSNLW